MRLRAIIVTLVYALYAITASAQLPIPRDTVAARQLEAIAATLRAPVTLPTVLAFPDAAAVKQRTDTVRHLMRSSTSCTTTACRTRVRTLQTQIDSIVAKPNQPAPTPQPDPPPPPNPQPTPTPTPTPDPVAGVELPRVVPSKSDPTPGKACTINVAAGGNVNAALQQAVAAKSGVVCLAAGTYAWGVILPVRPVGDTGWITIRAANMPVPEGTRVRRSHAASMPRILLNVAGAEGISTAVGTPGNSMPGTHHWYIAGIAIHASQLTYAMVRLGGYGYDGDQDTYAEVPHHIIFSRMVMTADSIPVRRCIAANSAWTAFVDSWIADCHEKGSDAQAIGGWNGPGPFLVDNNHLEGSGENIMWGGSAVSIPGLVAQDITITRNNIFTPPSWRGNGSNTPWTKKNLFEAKNMRRVLLEGNVLDGSWSDGQVGWAIIIRDDGCEGAGGAMCASNDITIRRNLIRNANSGVNIGYPNVGRVAVVENVMELGAYGAAGGDRRGLQYLEGVVSITTERNLVVGPNISAVALTEGGRPCVFKDNVFAHGEYGFYASGMGSGLPAIRFGCGATYTWSGNTLIHPTATDPNYPPGTSWATSEAAVPLAAQIRAIVTAATAGVVVPP